MSTYDSQGTGPALLLLHAFPLDRTMWDSTVSAMRERHRVITMDLMGLGSIEDMADGAVALLDSLGIPMANVCGLSMGGYAALAMVARHPARLSSLVLADTRAGADSADARKARDQGIASVREQGVAAFAGPLINKLLSAHAPESMRAQVRAIAERQSPEAIIAALRALRDRPDRTAELVRIRCPALVLVGAADQVTPLPESRAMAREIPGAKYVELAGAGHLSNLEQPDAFNASLGQFLTADS